ncbi:hypothetical protein FHG89_26005 [Micromonospora orduensis]|uniref:Uncharacterized protein n=1 Tax=Micromonospora orduensis TaxID=1420891 RepID=A0A5C4QG75_9ACTN|nr:hypothetical protein [Micromonospora orduensis]TNH23967.1 hypothetical protein FHG89_26005 [Micromonospora orduensis]
MRAELLAVHVVVEDSASQWDRRAEEYRSTFIRQLLVPVPLSYYRAGLDVGELVSALDGAFWEVRLADTEATLARLADVMACGPACRWSVEADADDGGTLDYVLDHGPGCEETEEEPPELETGPLIAITDQ